MNQDTRGQAFTLEGVAAAVLLLASLVFALQVGAVTPNSGSTASPNIGTQQAWVASDLLASAGADGSLVELVTYWDENERTFHGANSYGYYADTLPASLAIGNELDSTFDRRGFAYNIDLAYVRGTAGLERIQVVNRGTPSDDAIRVVQYVTLYDDDTLTDSDGNAGTTLSNASFYATDVSPDSPVFNVLRVEVTVWRV